MAFEVMFKKLQQPFIIKRKVSLLCNNQMID